jgi:hypothetical protein
MPMFATLVASLFGSLASFFGLQMAKKTLFATAAIAAGLVLTLAMFAAIKGLIAGIGYAFPPWAMGWFVAVIPSNAVACAGAIIAAKMARFVYDYNMENLKIASYIT